MCGSYKYQILSDMGLFRDHKWISGKILAHKNMPIVLVYHIFLDKFSMFTPNVHEMANLTHCVMVVNLKVCLLSEEQIHYNTKKVFI